MIRSAMWNRLLSGREHWSLMSSPEAIKPTTMHKRNCKRQKKQRPSCGYAQSAYTTVLDMNVLSLVIWYTDGGWWTQINKKTSLVCKYVRIRAVYTYIYQMYQIVDLVYRRKKIIVIFCRFFSLPILPLNSPSIEVVLLSIGNELIFCHFY